MPLDNAPGPMSAALGMSAPAPAAPPPSPAPSSPPPPATGGQVPDDFFSQIGPAIAKATQNLIADENTPGPDAPPPLFLPPPPKPPEYNPMHAWGSSAMMLALLGSLLTRRPITTAISAAGQVLNAYNQGDAAAAKGAYDNWKTQTANALNLAKYEQSAYANAIKAHQGDERAQIAELTALTTAMKDSPALAALQTGGVGAVADMVKKRGKAASSVAASAAELQDYHANMQIMAEWEKAHPKPTDPAKLAQWTTDSRAEYAKVFGSQLAKSGEDLADIPGPDGYSDNEMKALVQQYMQPGGKKPIFGSGKAAALAEQHFNTVMANVIMQNGANGGSSGANTPRAGLTKTSLDALGQAWAKGAPLSALMSGMGTQSTDVKAAIINAGIAYLQSQGKDPMSFLTAQTDYHSNQQTLNALTKMANSAAAYEQTTLDNMRIAERLQAKGIPTNISPLLNQIAQNGEVQSGNPDVMAYGAALMTVMTEYAKVMSGGTGSVAASSDSAREEAQSLINKFGTAAQANAVFAVMRADMQNKISEYANSIQVINNAIASGVSATGSTGNAGSGAPDISSIPAPAIAQLKANPSTAAQFDEVFGPGAAEAILGK